MKVRLVQIIMVSPAGVQVSDQNAIAVLLAQRAGGEVPGLVSANISQRPGFVVQLGVAAGR